MSGWVLVAAVAVLVVLVAGLVVVVVRAGIEQGRDLGGRGPESVG